MRGHGMDANNEQIVRGEDFVTRQIAGETLIVPIRGGTGELDSIFALNETGSFIWGMIGEGIRFEQMVLALCAQYDVGEQEAAKDLSAFVESLKDAGLIRYVQASAD